MVAAAAPSPASESALRSPMTWLLDIDGTLVLTDDIYLSVFKVPTPRSCEVSLLSCFAQRTSSRLSTPSGSPSAGETQHRPLLACSAAGAVETPRL